MHTNSHMLSFTTRQRTITDALPCRDISRPSTLISRVTPLQKHNDAPLNSRKIQINVGYKQSLLAILAPILLLTQSPEQFPAAAAPAAPNTATSVAGQNVGLLKGLQSQLIRKPSSFKSTALTWLLFMHRLRDRQEEKEVGSRLYPATPCCSIAIDSLYTAII